MKIYRKLLSPAASVCAVLLLTGVLNSAEEGPPSAHTLEELRSVETSIALRKRAVRLMEPQEAAYEEAKAEGNDWEAGRLEDLLETLVYVDRHLGQIINSGASDRERWQANAYAQRILEGVEFPVEGELFPSPKKLFDGIVVGGLIGHKVPGVSKRKQQLPMGEAAALRESPFLYDKGGDRFYTVEELAAMTPEEVSRLDVPPDHPNWYDDEAFAKIDSDAPGHFERFLEDGLTRALRREGVLGPNSPDYDMQTARRVLFLDYIFDAATSPKGQASDSFGVAWKLKWGPESSTESVTWQLYTLAGSKATDVVLTNGAGPAEMILVMMDPEEAAAQPEVDTLRYPSNLEELLAAVEEFYEFDLNPFIHSHGTITSGNVDELLQNLPSGGKPEYQRDRLIGRQWVAFKESCIELPTKGVMRRGDGVRLSDELAINDRVARASFLFDMWVANRDVKDDNSEAFFILNSTGDDIALDGYREGRHDQGLTLGSLTAAGDLNSFDVDGQFMGRGLFGNLRFKQSIIYKPATYDMMTWADGKWMARHLAAITDEELRAAAKASLWPDFAQEALIYRLANRRDRMAELFGLSGPSTYPAPSLTVPLGRPEEIAAAESRYGLPAGVLAEELARRGKGSGYADTVLKNGVITSTQKSPLVCLLTRHLYPSGLATRFKMMSKKPPKTCGP